MDPLSSLRGLPRPVYVVDAARVRVHVECEACREDARVAADARASGVTRAEAEAGPVARADAAARLGDGTGFGPAAREGAVRSNAVAAGTAGPEASAPAAADGSAAAAGPDGLSAPEREQLAALAARDREVRRHEEAHARVGGQYAGQPSYTYQTGPDGRRYAIGGEVPIDIAPVPGDPEATIDKMDIVKRAALAPAEPSAADRRVAQIADAQRLEAQAELAGAGVGALPRLVSAVRAGDETLPGAALSRAV